MHSTAKDFSISTTTKKLTEAEGNQTNIKTSKQSMKDLKSMSIEKSSLILSELKRDRFLELHFKFKLKSVIKFESSWSTGFSKIAVAIEY